MIRAKSKPFTLRGVAHGDAGVYQGVTNAGIPKKKKLSPSKEKKRQAKRLATRRKNKKRMAEIKTKADAIRASIEKQRGANG
jgi:hypothetical protein